MTNSELEAKLRQYYEKMPTAPAPASLSNLLQREMDGSTRRKRLTFRQFLSMQIRFIGWKVWAAQGGALLAICATLAHLFGQEYWREPAMVARLLFCLAVLTAMAAPPFLYRSVRYKMQEVEAAARFSSAQQLLARLIIIGAGDGVLLGGMLLTAAATSGLQLGSAALSVGLPFLLASGGCLYLLGHVSPRHFLAGSMGLCGALLTGALMARRQFSFSNVPAVGWIVICALLAAFCIWQLHGVLHRRDYAEMQVA